jgi:hypothetical protein
VPTYSTFLAASMWACVKPKERKQLSASATLGPLFGDQAAADGGRNPAARLLTGQPQTPTNLAAANVPRDREELHPPLLAPVRPPANLAYRKDLDWLENWQQVPAKAKATPAPAADPNSQGGPRGRG